MCILYLIHLLLNLIQSDLGHENMKHFNRNFKDVVEFPNEGKIIVWTTAISSSYCRIIKYQKPISNRNLRFIPATRLEASRLPELSPMSYDEKIEMKKRSCESENKAFVTAFLIESLKEKNNTNKNLPNKTLCLVVLGTTHVA